MDNKESDLRRRTDQVQSVVYVVTNPDGKNAVEAYSRDRSSGRLTHLGRYETDGRGDPNVGGVESHSLVGDRHFVYVVNPGSDTVSAMAVRNDGSLRLLGSAPSGGRRPVSVAVHGNLLYVVNQGNIPGSAEPDQLPASYSGFHIRADGTLEPIAGSTITLPRGASPGEILFNRDGSRLIACQLGGNLIDTYYVGKNGILQRGAQLTGLPGAFGSLFNPRVPANLLVTLAGGEAGPPAPGVVSFRLADDGLHQVSLITDAEQKDPCWLAITPDGRCLWASSFIPRSLTMYVVDGEGRITKGGANIPPATGLGSTDIAVDPAGRFLYQLRAFDVDSNGQNPLVPEIHVFSVTANGAEGNVHQIQTVAMPKDLDSTGVMGMLVIDLD